MEDVEEIDGMNTQLKTSKKPFTHIVISVEILKFGLALSSKSYSFTKEAHFGQMIIKIVKSSEEG
jgi:hypothetical protein